MKTPTSNEILGEFVLAHACGLELPRRARLYRALAEVIGDEKDAAQFIALANDCDAIERKHQQLVLDFKRRAL